MMQIRAHVERLLQEKAISALDAERALSAVTALEDVLGKSGPLVLADVVQLPDDDARYIVVGLWDDGTMDLFREHGMYSRDHLVGWVPGQTLAQYYEELNRDEPD